MSRLWPSLWSPEKNEIDPFRSVGREMFDMFNRITKQWPGLPAGFGDATPALNVAETKDAIEISAELPGIDDKDVEIKLANGTLTIKGEKSEEKEEEGKEYYLSERRYGAFQRSFRLPDGVDADRIAATFAKGVLTVTLPKTAEAKKSARKIDVKSA